MATRARQPNPLRFARLQRQLARALRKKAKTSLRPVSCLREADRLDKLADAAERIPRPVNFGECGHNDP